MNDFDNLTQLAGGEAYSEQPQKLMVNMNTGDDNCPGDCTLCNGHLFRLFKDGKTWAEAKADCETRGGHLATSTSAEKDKFLSSLAEGRAAWLGGTDEENEGIWKWVNGENWDYTNWCSGEPNNSSGREHYLQINYDSNGRWNDLSDSFVLYYLCECNRNPYVSFNDGDISHERLNTLLGGNKDGHYHLTEYEFDKLHRLIEVLFPNGEENPIFPSGTLDINNPNCPSDCTLCNGHKFKLFSDTKTWAEAKADCESRGGHLATSTSEEKNEFLKSIAIGKSVWLGGTDEENEGVWKWITGENWDYTNWHCSVQPDNVGGIEHYLQFTWNGEGKWNDLPATSKLRYICECEDKREKLLKLIDWLFPDGAKNPICPYGKTGTDPNNPAPDDPNPDDGDDLDPFGGLPAIEPPDWRITNIPSTYYFYENAGRMYYGMMYSSSSPYIVTGLLVPARSSNSQKYVHLLQTTDLVNWKQIKSTALQTYGETLGDCLCINWNKSTTNKAIYNKFYVMYSPNTAKVVCFHSCASGSTWGTISTSGATSLVAGCYSPDLRIALLVSADGTVSRLNDNYAKDTGVSVARINDNPAPLCGLHNVNLGCAVWINQAQCFCISGKEGTATSITGAAGTWTLHTGAPKDLRGLTFREDIEGGCLLAWCAEDKLFYVSRNGKTWVRYSQKAIPLDTVSSVAYSPDYKIYCAVGTPGNIAYLSKDLKHWVASKIADYESLTAEDIIWMDSTQKFVMRPANGELLYTFNPADWRDD